jgi:FkbM family methyltransferase
VTRIRFSLVDLALVTVVAIAGTWFFTWSQGQRQLAGHYFVEGPMRDLAPLRDAYGPDHHSENVEEWIIRDFFQDKRGGVFLDVGASHHQSRSNTYYLERHLDWSGVAIDALTEFADGYRQHRPRTIYLPMFASDVADQSVRFYVPERNHVSSADEAFAKGLGDSVETRQVPTTTLNHALEQSGHSQIDFLSMDIELSEPTALKGFDIETYRPALVCIEAHLEVRQQILDYFDQHGYRVLGKYLRADPSNLYFSPRPTPADHAESAVR